MCSGLACSGAVQLARSKAVALDQRATAGYLSTGVLLKDCLSAQHVSDKQQQQTEDANASQKRKA